MPVALVALGIVAWLVTATIYFGPFGGADAGPQEQFRDLRTHFVVPRDGQWYNVQIEFFVMDDGKGNFDQKADDARKAMLGRFPGAFEVQPGQVTAQYVPSGFWWPSRSVQWAYDPAGKPAGLTGEDAALSAAAATWNNAGGAFTYSGGTRTTADTGACSGAGLDGTNTIGWAPQSGSVLAITCTWYGGSGSPSVAAEFDMEIDPDWSWTTGSSIDVDLQSVVTHELGHALGLNHAPDSSSIMYASYCTGCDKRQLASDDIAGLVAIYGPAATQPAVTPVPATPTVAPPSPTATPRTRPQSPRFATPANGAAGTAPVSSLGLLPGPNLVTWPSDDAPPSSAFPGQGGSVAAIYTYDAATRSWLRYFPDLPPYASDLQMLHYGQAYWVLTTPSAKPPAP